MASTFSRRIDGRPPGSMSSRNNVISAMRHGTSAFQLFSPAVDFGLAMAILTGSRGAGRDTEARCNLRIQLIPGHAATLQIK